MNLRECCNWLDRSQIVDLLESSSIQCYDNESRDDLVETLIECVADGDILESSIRDLVE